MIRKKVKKLKRSKDNQSPLQCVRVALLGQRRKTESAVEDGGHVSFYFGLTLLRFCIQLVIKDS
jgi:hypothetical protein